MSEEKKSLQAEVETLVKELRDRSEDMKDVVRQEEVKAIQTELEGKLQEVNDALAAMNTPVVEKSASDEELEIKEAIGEWFAKGDAVLERGADRSMLIKAVGDQVSLTVASEGGNLLPKIMGELIDGQIRNASPVRQLARVINSGLTYTQPIKTSKGTAATRTETGAIHSSPAPQFDTISFTNFEVDAEEMATHWAHEGDAVVDLLNVITSDIAAAIAEKGDEEYVKGTTLNPLANGGTVSNGLLSHTKLVTEVDDKTNTVGSMAGVETAAVDAIDWVDLATLRSSLNGRYNGSYLFSRDVELALLTKKDNEGRFIWTMGDVTTGTKNKIFGDDYATCDFFPKVADAGDVPLVVYGDFSKFVIADASPLRWTVDALTNKAFVKYLARRRTSSSIVDFAAFRALYLKPTV